jgi:hypothetical protein
MKHLALILILLLSPAAYAVEDVTPATVTAGTTLEIVGPIDAIAPGADAWLKVSGLTLDEIKAAKANGQFDMTVFPLSGVRVHATYDWLNDTLELMFTAEHPGEYLVKLHLLREGKLEIAAIVVAVEGDSPDPFPDPKPDPEPDPSPIPPGPRLALILHESSAITHQQAAVAESLRRYLSQRPADKQQCLYRLLDKDTPTVGNWADPYKAEIARRQIVLPALVLAVLPTSGDPFFVSVDPLPLTAADAVKLVEEGLK